MTDDIPTKEPKGVEDLDNSLEVKLLTHAEIFLRIYPQYDFEGIARWSNKKIEKAMKRIEAYRVQDNNKSNTSWLKS